MTLAIWPVGVNQSHLRGSYREEPEPNADQFEVDHGPALENLATSVSTFIISFEMSVTPTEYDALIAFWRTTLRSGTQLFRREHPLTDALSKIFKFMAPPKLLNSDFSKYRVSIVLRYFPDP